jgi:hypothetical protein
MFVRHDWAHLIPIFIIFISIPNPIPIPILILNVIVSAPES